MSFLRTFALRSHSLPRNGSLDRITRSIALWIPKVKILPRHNTRHFGMRTYNVPRKLRSTWIPFIFSLATNSTHFKIILKTNGRSITFIFYFRFSLLSYKKPLATDISILSERFCVKEFVHSLYRYDLYHR